MQNVGFLVCLRCTFTRSSIISIQQEAFSYLLQSIKGEESSSTTSNTRDMKSCNQSKEFFEDLTVELQVNVFTLISFNTKDIHHHHLKTLCVIFLVQTNGRLIWSHIRVWNSRLFRPSHVNFVWSLNSQYIWNLVHNLSYGFTNYIAKKKYSFELLLLPIRKLSNPKTTA